MPIVSRRDVSDHFVTRQNWLLAMGIWVAGVHNEVGEPLLDASFVLTQHRYPPERS
jgi:hypothetical protein